MKPFTERFKPKNTKEIYGQDFAISKLKDFILGFKHQKKKAAIVYGPTGIGKTATVYAIANELNLEIIELNASDYRKSSNIDSIIKPAMSQMSLFMKSKLILIDEIDGVSGTQDRGGAQALASLLDETKFPIVIIANDPFDSKFSTLRKKSNLIEFKALNYLTISSFLESICDSLKIKFDQETLKHISIKANGDLRAAINDLQCICEGKSSISMKDLDILGDRDKKDLISNSLRLIFKTRNAKDALRSLNNTDIDLDEATLWIDENIPLEYSGQDIARAYDSVSKSDVFHGRIIRRQHYRFLVYQSNILTVGVSLSKSKIYPNYTNYVRSSRILKYWLAKNKYLKRKEISKKIGKATHTSLYKTINSTYPYFRIMFQRNKFLGIADELKFDEEEKDYLASK